MPEATIDGVQTLWEDLPGQFTASLIFGVGDRDADFLTATVPHLVEHLAMNGLPKSHIFRNASVTLDTTEFTGSGSPEEVFAFLAHVCRNLADLPWSQSERELRVLEREDGSSVHPALAWALGERFGLRGPGVSNTNGPIGSGSVTEERVRSFVQRYFVRENAVLVLSKKPPTDLRLDLPSGAPNAREATPRVKLPLPAMVHDQTARTVLSFELPDAVCAQATIIQLLESRILDEARHLRGLIYAPVSDFADLGTDGRIVAVQTDPRDEDAGEVLSIMWSCLNDLANRGASIEEIDRVRAGFLAYADDVGARFGWLQGLAYQLLLGTARSEEELRAAYLDLTPEQVREWAATAVRTTLASVPEELDQEPVGLPCISERLARPQRFEGNTYPRRLARFGSDGTVTANEDGVSTRWAGGRWSDVVGVGTANGLRQVVFADGRAVVAQFKHLRKAARLFATIDDRVGHLAFPVPDDQR